jgi:hypothetical protein
MQKTSHQRRQKRTIGHISRPSEIHLDPTNIPAVGTEEDQRPTRNTLLVRGASKVLMIGWSWRRRDL